MYIPIEKASKLTNNGDILLARYGASLGKVFRAHSGAYNVAMAKVIPLFSGELVNMDWLEYFYRSELYQGLLKNYSRSAQAGFNKEDLDSLLIPLPPLAEQERIVVKLDKLLPLCEGLKEE